MPDIGSVHRAKVVSTKPFGAFVAIDGYREHGLVHISQLAPRRVELVEDVVERGDEVYVYVLGTEPNRLSVSMRRVDQTTGEVLDDEREGERRGSGDGGGGGGGEGDAASLPELYSIHRGQVPAPTHNDAPRAAGAHGGRSY
eukprot:4011658-Pleurochrysis_carterae.AAC.1